MLRDTDYLFLDGDDPTVRELLGGVNTERLRSVLGAHTTVFIDEAQRIDDIGLTLKILTDQFNHVQLFVSGSSAFELGNRSKESLTGRKWEFLLLPISWGELEGSVGYLRAEQQLELRVLYGMYPEVVTRVGDEVETLRQLSDSYLYKDILSFGGIRKPHVLEQLLRALALQVGSEVSYNELAQLLGIDKSTVASYIDILIKGYVLFRIPSFKRNLRNEIKANQKVYFHDTGIRNMVIGNFTPLDTRSDKGSLWENFLISERLKALNYSGSLTNPYFWRTRQQQEIDYVEERAGAIAAYEIKWRGRGTRKGHGLFEETYGTEVVTIGRENFREFLNLPLKY